MKLGLGTAQFGSDYGISNESGRTPSPEVENCLSAAAKGGVRFVDTARGYKESEKVLGELLPKEHGFSLVTKSGSTKLRASLTESLKYLKQSSVYGFLLHQPEAFMGPEAPQMFRTMKELKNEGLIRKMGVSVYTTEQALKLIEKHSFDMIQLPLNVFDQSFLTEGVLKKLKDHGVEIHTRSLFLQGLLLMESEALPEELRGLAAPLERLKETARRLGTSPHQLAIDFVRRIPEVDAIIVGVNDVRQLDKLIKAFAAPYLTLGAHDCDSLAVSNPRLTNPALWEIKKSGGRKAAA